RRVIRADGQRLGGAAAVDRTGVVVVARVDGVEVEGAGRVELVRLRVRDGAADDRVDGRGQVFDQAGAVVVGVERVADGAARIRGRAGQRGGVVGRGADATRFPYTTRFRARRVIRADGQRLGGAAAVDR